METNDSNHDSHKVVIVGEIHGVRENVEAVESIYREMSKDGSVVVGFEWPQSLVDNPDSESEDLLNDGRFSPIHREFLLELKAEGVKVFGFDISKTDWEIMPKDNISWRDEQMAKKINGVTNTLSESERLLLVCGDAHFQTKPGMVKTPGGVVEFVPMASRLNVKSLKAIHLRYLSGQFWNCGLKEIRTYEIDEERCFRPSDEVIEMDIKCATPVRYS